jgi:hypothetical protein
MSPPTTARPPKNCLIGLAPYSKCLSKIRSLGVQDLIWDRTCVANYIIFHVPQSEEREQRREAKLEWLRAEIQKGLDSGPAREVDIKEWAEDIKRRGRERLAAGIKPDDL